MNMNMNMNMNKNMNKNRIKGNHVYPNKDKESHFLSDSINRSRSNSHKSSLYNSPFKDNKDLNRDIDMETLPPNVQYHAKTSNTNSNKNNRNKNNKSELLQLYRESQNYNTDRDRMKEKE